MNLTKEGLFYFDIEWTPKTKTLDELKTAYPKLYTAFTSQAGKWNALALEDGKEYTDPELFYKHKAHFYPELCQIICVSYGFFQKGSLIIKSIYGEDEYQLLNSAASLFTNVAKSNLILSGAGIVRYDMPWLSKRMMVRGINPPKNLNVYGKKPWDIEVFDVIEVWGQGCKQEAYTPLELICAALNLETSKDDLSGDKVADAYWNGELERIKTYCEKDVKVTIDCATELLRLS